MPLKYMSDNTLETAMDLEIFGGINIFTIRFQVFLYLKAMEILSTEN